MYMQNSFASADKGVLYVVPTPIGNLNDMTFRAIDTLKEVDLIAAEDTRHTKKLLNHFSIQTPLISYHEHNERMRVQPFIERLEKGETIALVSDAGMPAISDPGYILIQAVIDVSIPVIVLPGANAALCALVGSGLPTDEFYFYGFLPRKKKEKEAILEKLKQLQTTLIFYESPHRLINTLKVMYKILGDCQISIARELTKRFETYIRGKLTDVLSQSDLHYFKGECCLVVEGKKDVNNVKDHLWWSHLSIVEHVDYYVEREQLRRKEAIKRVATERNISSRYVYRMYHVQ